MVAPHGRGNARLLHCRGLGRPPLLALPRRPLRPRRGHPAMVRAWGVWMIETSLASVIPGFMPGIHRTASSTRQWACAICSDGARGWLDPGDKPRDDIARRRWE